MRQLVRRLRSPRYAFAMLFGFLYFFMVFGGPAIFDRRHPSLRPDATPDVVAILTQAFAPVMLAILAAVWWIWGVGIGGLALTPAETNFLVPAPVSRRRLIEYKLLSAQTGILTSAIMFTVVLRLSSLEWWLRLPTLWVIFTILHMHQVGSGLVHTSLQSHGRAAWRRVWPATIIFSAILTIVAMTIVRTVAAVRAAPDTAAIGPAINAIFAGPVTHIALAPFAAITAPFNATSISVWASSFSICVLIVVLHYVWVVHMDAAFEESAAERGVKVANMIEAMRKGKRLSQRGDRKLRKSWFRMGSAGTPAFGIWWKNVLSFTRSLSLRSWFVLMMLLVVATAAIDPGDTHSIRQSFLVSGGILMLIGAAVGLLGPLAIRIDLRTDLRRIELLRTLPVGGLRLIVAEIGAAAFAIALMEFVPLLIGGALVLASGKVTHIGLILLLTALTVLLLLASNGVQLAIHNGFALFFPAWSRIGGTGAAGIEALGQNIIVMIGSLLLVVLSLIAPVLVALSSAAAMFTQLGRYAVVPAVLAFLATLFIEVFAAFVWLGRAYDSIDPVESGLCS